MLEVLAAVIAKRLVDGRNEHCSPDGAQRNPGLTRRRPRIALRSSGLQPSDLPVGRASDFPVESYF